MNRFDKKTVLITGGASGIGKATVLRMASEGANVIIADINERSGEQLAENVCADGGSASFLKADVSCRAGIESMSAQVFTMTKTLDILVNSAGIGGTKHVEEVTYEDWEPITGINLQAPMMVSLALLPLMKDNGGAIVNIASDGGLKGRATVPVYDATKAGVISITKTCAAGFIKYGIRVNVVAPGPVITEFHYGNDEDAPSRKKALEQLKSANLMQRWARPEEIASSIAFLASEDASHITGTVLCVDGGSSDFNFNGKDEYF